MQTKVPAFFIEWEQTLLRKLGSADFELLRRWELTLVLVVRADERLAELSCPRFEVVPQTFSA